MRVGKGFLCLTALALTFSFRLLGRNFAAAVGDSSQRALGMSSFQAAHALLMLL